MKSFCITPGQNRRIPSFLRNAARPGLQPCVGFRVKSTNLKPRNWSLAAQRQDDEATLERLLAISSPSDLDCADLARLLIRYDPSGGDSRTSIRRQRLEQLQAVVPGATRHPGDGGPDFTEQRNPVGQLHFELAQVLRGWGLSLEDLHARSRRFWNDPSAVAQITAQLLVRGEVATQGSGADAAGEDVSSADTPGGRTRGIRPIDAPAGSGLRTKPVSRAQKAGRSSRRR